MDREASPSMGIQVWYSNQLERLADRLISNLELTWSRGPRSLRLFTMPPIIVPNMNIAVYLKYEIARSTGITAGLKFQMLEEFLGDLLHQTKATPHPRLVKGSLLRAFFIDVLAGGPDGVAVLPDSVQRYLSAGGETANAMDLRRFQLGSQLADLARQYSDYRPEWLKAWTAGRVIQKGGPLAGIEQWQRELWCRLIEQVHAQTNKGVPWVLPFELFTFLDSSSFSLPATVHLFWIFLRVAWSSRYDYIS